MSPTVGGRPTGPRGSALAAFCLSELTSVQLGSSRHHSRGGCRIFHGWHFSACVARPIPYVYPVWIGG